MAAGIDRGGFSLNGRDSHTDQPAPRTHYTHHYREAYLGRLGLDPEALPITTHEAIVEGFDGIVTTILWKLALVTLFIPVNLAIVWIGGVLLEGFATKFGITSERRTPHPLLIALGRSVGFRASVSCLPLRLA